MSARAAISLVKPKSSAEILLLRCHVRPGASKAREGVVTITDEVIELCVSAPPQDGKANKAVLEVLSEVSDPCISHICSTDFEIWPHLIRRTVILYLLCVGLGHAKIQLANYPWVKI